MKITLGAHPAGVALLFLALLFVPPPLVLSALAALALHEGAHVLAMALCGAERCSLNLTPFGGVADVPGYERLAAWRQALIAGAGVLGSGLCALLCLWLRPPGELGNAFTLANLSLAALNCLPLMPLDGARVALAAAAALGCARAAERALLAFSYAASIGLTLLGLYGAWMGRVNLSLIVLGPYLAYAAHEGEVYGRVRRMENRISGMDARRDEGEAKEAKVYACYGEPDALALTRLLRKTGDQRRALLHVFRKQSGEWETTLSEAQMAGILLRDPLHCKKDFPDGLR